MFISRCDSGRDERETCILYDKKVSPKFKLVFLLSSG